ncbi:hypothetical protein LTR17_018815 [Elasticomyces elasticus]|nr:hypothetical protein LTR17_018815 [Elasticomyces elasticus]
MEYATGSNEIQLDSTRESRYVAYIIHSSGSTSLPRPNYVTHLAALGNSSSPTNLVGFVTLPTYHMFGLGCLFRSIMNMKHVYMYNAHLPLSNRYLINTLSEHRELQVLYTVPYVVELMAESTQGTELLAGLTNVFMSGSACPKPIGDNLAGACRRDASHPSWQHGDRATNVFGSPSQRHTGVGLAAAFLCAVTVSANGGPGGSVVSNRSDGSYATKDLYERHPDWPRRNAWRYYARKDDTIVLSNGEKANPLVLEGVARENALVAEAVVFGTHKPHLGMFLVRANSVVSDANVIAAVWPLVEATNVSMPTHASLSREAHGVLRSKVRACGPSTLEDLPD